MITPGPVAYGVSTPMMPIDSTSSIDSCSIGTPGRPLPTARITGSRVAVCADRLANR
ncbi:hypothetical protein D3C76_1833340 [compost metagenome]